MTFDEVLVKFSRAGGVTYKRHRPGQRAVLQDHLLRIFAESVDSRIWIVYGYPYQVLYQVPKTTSDNSLLFIPTSDVTDTRKGRTFSTVFDKLSGWEHVTYTCETDSEPATFVNRNGDILAQSNNSADWLVTWQKDQVFFGLARWTTGTVMNLSNTFSYLVPRESELKGSGKNSVQELRACLAKQRAAKAAKVTEAQAVIELERAIYSMQFR